VVFAFATAAITYRTSTRIYTPSEPEHESWGLIDFRDAVYYPVVAMLDGENPYDPALYRETYPVGQVFPLYSPATLLIHLPFGLLSPELAPWAYYAFSVVLTVLLAYLALRFTRPQPAAAATFLLAALIIVSRPGHWNLIVGQYVATMTVGVYVALLFARDRPWLAGLGIALSTIKPTFGGPLVVLMLARGDVRAVAIGLAIAACAGALGALPPIVAAGGMMEFAEIIPINQAAFGDDTFTNPLLSPVRVDLAVLAARLVGTPLPTIAGAAFSLAILVAGASAIWRIRDDETDPRPISAAVACLTIVACTYHLAYDLVVLTAPAVMLAVGSPRDVFGARPVLRFSLLGAALLLAGNYLASQNAVERLSLTGSVWLIVTSANAVAVLTLLTGYIVAALWRPFVTSSQHGQFSSTE